MSDRRLNLLGVFVDSHDSKLGMIHWEVIRGGYHIRITLRLLSDNQHSWATCLHGNVGAFSKEGSGISLDDCVRQAHLAIAHYLREVEEVHEFVLRVEAPPEVTSRYRRDPVI